MAVFSRIEFWPSSGWEHRPWTDDPATDALVKSACRVSQSYSDALRVERLEGPCSSLRFFSHLHDEDVVQLQVDTARPEGWESGLVFVPEVVAELSEGARAHLVLELIHQSVVELAPHRGWSLEAVERVRARVLAHDGRATDVGAIPEIARATYGSHVEDRTPGIVVFLGLGIGLRAVRFPAVDGTHFEAMIEREIFDRLRSGEGGISEWLDGLPVEIVLEYHLPGQLDGFDTFGLRMRRTAKRLRVVVLRDASWLASGEVEESQVRDETAQLVEQVMDASSGSCWPGWHGSRSTCPSREAEVTEIDTSEVRTAKVCPPFVPFVGVAPPPKGVLPRIAG